MVVQLYLVDFGVPSTFCLSLLIFFYLLIVIFFEKEDKVPTSRSTKPIHTII
jgi:hypothetical protein